MFDIRSSKFSNCRSSESSWRWSPTTSGRRNTDGAGIRPLEFCGCRHPVTGGPNSGQKIAEFRRHLSNFFGANRTKKNIFEKIIKRSIIYKIWQVATGETREIHSDFRIPKKVKKEATKSTESTILPKNGRVHNIHHN
jgi:hypothetical protein